MRINDKFTRRFAPRGSASFARSSKKRLTKIINFSKQVRLLLCDVISALLKASIYNSTINSLNPYYSDFILILQSQLRDPYPILKCRASLILVQLMRVPQWESGAMVFATAVARQTILNLRHRNAKVRIAR